MASTSDKAESIWEDSKRGDIEALARDLAGATPVDLHAEILYAEG